ncbi:MAG: hypothetical protein ACK559_38095, partial [bacterium]
MGDTGMYRKLRAGPAGDQGGVKIEELPVASAALRQGAPISSRQCVEQRAPLQGILGDRGAPPIVTDRVELVKVAREEEFHTGPVELSDLIQQADV